MALSPSKINRLDNALSEKAVSVVSKVQKKKEGDD